MPIFYRENVVGPENTQRLPPQQQQFTSKTSNTFPGTQSSNNSFKGNGSSTTTNTDFPPNFPHFPPPKGVIDDKQLERMAEQLMKGQQPTFEGQQISPGWTRHSQQSYTIETVVENKPENKPIYVGKHYEYNTSPVGVPSQKQQTSTQSQPVKHYTPPTQQTEKHYTPPTQQTEKHYTLPTQQTEKHYQQQYTQPKQQEHQFTKTIQQKQQTRLPTQEQKQYQQHSTGTTEKHYITDVFSEERETKNNLTKYREREEQESKEKHSVVDYSKFPSQKQQQYSKTITEYRQQNDYEEGKKDDLKQTQNQEQWQQSSQQWNQIHQQPYQPQQQWGHSQKWQERQQQPLEWQYQTQQQWQQNQSSEQQPKQLPQQWQQSQISTQQPQQRQFHQKQHFSPQQVNYQQAQEQPQIAKQENEKTNQVQPSQQHFLSKTNYPQNETGKQKIEKDLGEDFDEPPPDLQLAQADPEKLIEHEKIYQNEWEQEQPYQSHHLKQRQLQQTRNYDEPLYISAGDDQHPYYNQYYSPNSTIYWDSVYNDEWALRGANPPSFTTGPSWGDHLAYAQRMNLEKRRAESEKQRRHHTPVPGSAEYGYLFGGMDFVDHKNFDQSADVGEPFNEMEERHSRRDLHWGPPRRRGDFFGLDYRTMLPEEEQHRSHSAEDTNFYQGYQALPPRKNFRLCGHFTADHNAPLNIAEAQGLDEFDSQYWVGDTLSNQKVRPEYPLTEEEKRTFALLYGPGGFKPDHRTVIPEPKPEEPVQFSVTIGPKKEKKQQQEGYVNPMKVEGESWMLGQREEYEGQYGKLLHSTAEQNLPFHRPKHFPARVPNWAVERMNQMGRGARSLDRSLFLPSWAKIPQPQPPFWVKRDGNKVSGVWGNTKKQQSIEQNNQNQKQFIQQKEKEENTEESSSQQKQQFNITQTQTLQSPQQQSQSELVKLYSPQPKTQLVVQPIVKKEEQTQYEETQQKSKQQVFTQSQHSPQQTHVSITQKHQPLQTNSSSHYTQQQPQQQQQQFLHQSFTSSPIKESQIQSPNYQLIVTPTKTHQTNIRPSKQPLTSKQEQNQQLQQQQQYYQFFEGNEQKQQRSFPQQQFKQFTNPGGQYYGRNIPPSQQRVEQKMQQNQPQEGQLEEESGLENLAKMKLGKFPMRESLEKQQSFDNNVELDNKRQAQHFIKGVKKEFPPIGGQTKEEWRFSGQPQSGHQLIQSSTTTTTTSSISGEN